MTKPRAISCRPGSLRLATGALMLAVLLLVLPAAAGARTVTMDSCIGGDGSGWSGPTIQTRWDLTAGCPSTYLQSNDLTALNYWWTNWRLPAVRSGATNPLVGVEADLLGSDGSEGGRSQGLLACDEQNQCGPLFTPDGTDVWQPRHISMNTDLGGGIPDGATHVRLKGACVDPRGASACVAGRPLEMRNLRLTFEDVAQPTATLGTWDSYSDYPAVDLEGWNRGNVVLTVDGHDTGVGVQHIRYVFNEGAQYFSQDFACGFPGDRSIPRLCPVQVTDPLTVTPSLYPSRPGRNTVRVEVYDAAGHMSVPMIVEFKFENARPTLENVEATTATAWGWQSSPLIDLTWDNTGETGETNTQSGVARAKYSVYRKGNTVAAYSGTVEGEAIDHLDGLVLPEPGIWRIAVSTQDGAGNTSVQQTIEVGYDPAAPEAPEIDQPLGPFGRNALAGDAFARWSMPAGVDQLSGVCFWEFGLDRNRNADPDGGHQIPSNTPWSRLPSMLPDGENVVHVRAVSCAGEAGAVAHAAFDVDATPPAIEFSRPASSGWYDAGHPLRISTTGGATSLALSVDGGPAEHLSAESATVPLGDGRHEVSVGAVDALGNRATNAITVQVDDSPPLATIEPTDLQRPAIVRAAVSDPGAGLALAMVQIRSVIDGAWHQVGDAFAGAVGVGNGRLSVRIPDEAMEPGAYEVRVFAVDFAGHSSFTSTRLDGSPVTLNLPLRAQPRLELGFPAKSARSAGQATTTDDLRPSVTVAYGRRAALRGVLVNPTGDPLPGMPVEIVESVRGVPASVVASVTTDTQGRFEHLATAGPSRQLTARFGGSDQFAPASANARLLVRGKTTLRVTARRAGRSNRLRFSGRIGTNRASIPRSGLRVVVQYRVRGGWANFPVEIRSVGDRFNLVDGPRRFGGPVKFRFRAVVKSESESGWPYETAVSRVQTVVVR